MNRRPSIGPSPPPSDAEPPSAVVPQPVSTSPAATAPTVSFRREAVRILSSCVSGGFPPCEGKMASESGPCHPCVRNELCGPCVHGPGGCALRAGLAASRSRRQEMHVTRRLSLAGQLLALQVVIICVVLVGVAAVTVAQSTQARAGVPRAGGRCRVAETLANSRALRDAVDDGGVAYVRVAAESTRSVSGSASVVVALRRPDGHRQRRPRRSWASRFDVGDSTVLDGRALGRASGSSTAARRRSRWCRS